MKHTLPKRIHRYLKEQEVSCKASTVNGYRTILGGFHEHLKRTSPKNPIGSLTKKKVRDYLSLLCKKNLKPYTQVNYLLAVKKYLAWEREREKLPEDLLSVLDRSKLPLVPEYLPRPLSAENDQYLKKILRESDHPHAPLFLLLRQTGMRISELINLPPDCILTGSKNEKYLKVPLGKMNTERLVPLCDESDALIGKIQRHQNNENLNRLIGMKGSIPHVYGQLSRQFKKITSNMTDQNKPITFHRLRHTYATSLLTGGVSLPSLMKLLGHRRIEMTLRYAKVTPQHLRNEYLRAVQTLEAQSSIAQIKIITENAETQLHPVEIIRQLASYLSHRALIPHKTKKNILLRLSRLENDLAPISFYPPKKITSPNMGLNRRAD